MSQVFITFMLQKQNDTRPVAYHPGPEIQRLGRRELRAASVCDEGRAGSSWWG